jgi:hypothetical protein
MEIIARKLVLLGALWSSAGCAQTIDLGCDDCPPPLALPASRIDIVERVAPGYSWACQLGDPSEEQKTCFAKRRQLILSCADQVLPAHMDTREEVDAGFEALHKCVYPKK